MENTSVGIHITSTQSTANTGFSAIYKRLRSDNMTQRSIDSDPEINLQASGFI